MSQQGFTGCYDCGEIFAVADLFPVPVRPMYREPAPDAPVVIANVCEDCLENRFYEQAVAQSEAARLASEAFENVSRVEEHAAQTIALIDKLEAEGNNE